MEGRTSHWFSMSTVFYPSILLVIVLHNANNDILESQLTITNHDANNDNLVVQLLSLLVQLLWCEQRQSGVATILAIQFILNANTDIQNYQSQLFAPSMPNMTPTLTSEGPKRSFILILLAILRIF